ncbi:hypothetical protein Zmor_002013 [Zophobas morio]|uniref:Uncharacterized protein n=1 Tax=Zophobas morio TaxID=2755281 RepID=A0AA38MTB7_9CUCU|nr:hypothetical protein Zmor_002013 [Zophobas morio]
MRRQRYQSAIRVWRSNYINFHSRAILPIGSVVGRAVFGAPGCGCSPPTTVILASTAAQHPSITKMMYEQAVTVANSWLGPGYRKKPTALRHRDRP